ncbi:TonB-dependent receptor [Aliidongia dinghuensis]|uniref:TonB-dependent receptor n=1 Tax=Aliidongia dinghuensis TaxID=1867774 RepID=A0A8J2YS10_9PROT|nr:TonB-dependent receptor [Aliidongia dinghuensis]GGF08348.1 TonB-dependent receptor [Aliidongia dinghuensis]
MGHHAIWVGVLAALAAGSANTVSAQTAPSGGDATATGKTAGQIEEITVTATKRTETVREIPQNISVLSGTQLQDQHVVDYQDLAQAVPGLSFTSGGAGGLGNIELRGVSSAAGAATVGIYLDDISLSVRNVAQLTGAAEPKLLDIDRVEVLRGPQGTLYGAGSEGGTIRFISNQPKLDTFEGSFHTELAGTDRGGISYDEEGMVNVPLFPGVAALRLSAGYSKDAGYLKRLGLDGSVLATDAGDTGTGVIRISGKWLLGDGWTVTPTLFYQNGRQDDQSIYYPNAGRFESIKQLPEPDHEQIATPTVVVTKDFGWSDLTSVSGFFWRKTDIQVDGTFQNSSYLASIAPTDDPTLANLESPIAYRAMTNQVSEELRLASKSMQESGLPITWVTGLYYSDQHLTTSDYEHVNGFSNLFQGLFGGPPAPYYQGLFAAANPGLPLPAGSNNWFANDFVYNSVRHYDERQYAIFGEINYAVLEHLKATAGLRYLYARESLNRFGGGYFDAGDPDSVSKLSRAYAATPKFALNYDITDNNSVYANATKGFRLGGPNRPVPSTICAADLSGLGLASAPDAYNSDSLWNYEVGTKNRLLNNRLAVTVALFDIEWKNIQQTVSLPGCGFDFVKNAGTARNYGAEVQVQAKVTEEITLGLNGAYTHDRLISVTPNTGASVDDRVLGTPDWTVGVNGEYRHAVTDALEGYLRADYNLNGKSSGTFNKSDPDHYRPVYGIANASFGVDAGSWQLEVFAKNLLNETKVIQRIYFSASDSQVTPRPLTVGLALSKQF